MILDTGFPGFQVASSGESNCLLVDDPKYTNILMGTVQFAIANGVLDAVREGILPKDRVNDLGIGQPCRSGRLSGGSGRVPSLAY